MGEKAERSQFCRAVMRWRQLEVGFRVPCRAMSETCMSRAVEAEGEAVGV